MSTTDPALSRKGPALPPVQVDGGFYVHPLADVETGATIGQGTRIWRFAHVRTGAAIGANCLVGNCVYVDTDVTIGDSVKLQNGVLVFRGVTLEDEVFVGPSATFTNDLYPRAISPNWLCTPTLVKRGASIGANATIVCGITIGECAMIAAGSVVTRDVAPYHLVRGNPARHVGYVCVCGHKLGDAGMELDGPITCAHCGRSILIP